MTTSTRTPEYSTAQIVKPFQGFESKYSGLLVSDNPIAIPGDLDAMAGKPGYDPNLLKGIPVPLGAKIYIWLPWFAPSTYGDTAASSYRYKLVWRLRSLADQVADADKKLSAHFGRLLPGVAQAPRTTGSPALIAASATLAGPRYVIPTAFESVQIVNNKYIIHDVSGTDMPVQKGTDGPAGPILPESQEPAKVAVVSMETNTFRGNYRAPLSPNYPTNWGGGIGPKVAAAGLLSQGYYPDQAGWAFSTTPNAQGYAAGSQAVIYETEVKGDELILLLDRPSVDQATENWDFSGVDRNVSRIFGTDAGTRAAIPTLGVYILTGSGVGTGQSYG